MAVSTTVILLSVALLAVALKWQGNGPHALAALLCALSAAQPISWVVTHAGLPPMKPEDAQAIFSAWWRTMLTATTLLLAIAQLHKRGFIPDQYARKSIHIGETHMLHDMSIEQIAGPQQACMSLPQEWAWSTCVSGRCSPSTRTRAWPALVYLCY